MPLRLALKTHGALLIRMVASTALCALWTWSRKNAKKNELSVCAKNRKGDQAYLLFPLLDHATWKGVLKVRLTVWGTFLTISSGLLTVVLR